MKLISYNVRGLGSSIKRKEGRDNFDWVYKASVGRLGGLLCVWDNEIFVKENERLETWTMILKMIEEGDNCWCIAGDFHSMRSVEERRGRSKHSNYREDLNEFIELARLVDLPLTRRKFTWYKSDGSAKSRLDRFLLSDEAAAKINEVDNKNEDGEITEEDILLRREGFSELWETWQRREVAWKEKTKLDWIEEPSVVKQEVREYFNKIFQEEQWDRLKLGGLQFKQLNEEDGVWLEREVSAEEVKQAVWDCGGDKSPGPDGFSFHIIKSIRNVIEKDIVDFVQEFSRNGKLVKGLNSSFIVLIPKKDNPIDLKDYKLISLIGTLYKIISKVLANRIKKVLPKVINGTQSAFLGGRQITYGILILNEVVEEIRRKKISSFIFKADFEKAYDSVNWAFLDEMMRRLGFGEKWRLWIKECLQTATVSVLVNGSPTEEFKMEKGLRQGDPIAPSLFLIVAEGLNVLIKSVVNKELFQGIPVGFGDLNISHLQFADDTVIMGKAEPGNIKVVKRILRWFELISSLKINFNKGVLYSCHVSDELRGMAAANLNCKSGSFPFTYLGMPIGNSWEKVCKGRNEGVLGVPDLECRNIALLGKWWDRFGKEDHSLWKRVIVDKFYGGSTVWDIKEVQTRNASTVWRNIVALGDERGRGAWMYREGFRWKLGMGDKINFWKDKWCYKIQDLWMSCYKWWGISISLPNSISLLCEAHSQGIKKLVTAEPPHCGYPGFNLSCSERKETLLHLPNLSNISVENIDYMKQLIQVYDPDNCFPKKLTSDPLSSSYFNLAEGFKYNFSLFSCPPEENRDLVWKIPCLSDTSSKVYAQRANSYVNYFPLLHCTKMRDVLEVPYALMTAKVKFFS
ncbi:hypothetical protein SLEP1_g35046 [Rubroshorea leprosula]|uniref:Reverse transcriptase domain-containing protein n=1 Tax=Rubroshorea leprosula TaxID=152421 RepID=A0AAV5KM06_9ROSI|nr:hypothetical protein SLEP1_g35046 [Rubroshorea leprosula]